MVISGGNIKRIQVKTGTYDLKTKSYRVNFLRHRRAGDRTEYLTADVDIFAVYCAGGSSLDLYFIPASEITGRNRSPRLFPHRRKLLEYSDAGECLEKFLNAFEVLIAGR
jgi:PD-(D/E)XK endonuclease